MPQSLMQELGLSTLPAGWQVLPLAELAQVRSGIALGGKKPKEPLDVPYIRVANVQDGYLDLQQVKHLQIERSQLARYALEAGDLLLTEGGNFDMLGRGDVWQGQIKPCIHQNHVFVVKTERSRLLPEFLNALTASSYGRAFFLRYGKRSTTLASISISQLRRFPVLLPPLAEQQRLCAALACWDAALQTSDELRANSLAQKDNLLHYLMRPGPGWRQCPLQELTRIDAETLSRRDWPATQPIRYLRIQHLKQGQIKGEPELHSLQDAPSRARRMVRSGNVLLSLVRPELQGIARAETQHDGCVASTGIAVLAAGSELDPDFLYHALRTSQMQQQIASIVAGTNYPQLSSQQVGQLQLRLPSRTRQHAISHCLNQAERRLQQEEQARSLLLAQKMALIEAFIHGRLLHCGTPGVKPEATA